MKVASASSWAMDFQFTSAIRFPTKMTRFPAGVRSAWPAPPHVRNITLDRLSRANIGVMVRSVAGGKSLPGGWSTRLRRKPKVCRCLLRSLPRRCSNRGNCVSTMAGTSRFVPYRTSAFRQPLRLLDDAPRSARKCQRSSANGRLGRRTVRSKHFGNYSCGIRKSIVGRN